MTSVDIHDPLRTPHAEASQSFDVKQLHATLPSIQQPTEDTASTSKATAAQTGTDGRPLPSSASNTTNGADFAKPSVTNLARTPNHDQLPSLMDALHSSQRTPTRETPIDDEDDIEFVLEPTPSQSEIDNESLAGFSTLSDIYSVSSQDHRGNGVACRYFNRPQGCSKGTSCPFSHAPDQYSVRSHPDGKNVCLYFLHNAKCRFSDQQCNYSHRRSDLLWDDDEIKEHLQDAIAHRKQEVAKQVTRGKAVSVLSERKKVRVEQAEISGPPEHGRLPFNLLFPEIQMRWILEMAQRIQRGGFTLPELNLLISFGPKHWDDHAWELLSRAPRPRLR